MSVSQGTKELNTPADTFELHQTNAPLAAAPVTWHQTKPPKGWTSLRLTFSCKVLLSPFCLLARLLVTLLTQGLLACNFTVPHV